MKKQIVFFVVGITVFAAGYVAQSWTLAQCQKPSGNSKACYDPDNQVGSCETTPHLECSEEKIIRVYEINQFPDGTEKADEGRTKTESAECWRALGCIWKGTQQNGHCESSEIWSAWRLKQKTVKKNDDEIEAGDECKPGE